MRTIAGCKHISGRKDSARLNPGQSLKTFSRRAINPTLRPNPPPLLAVSRRSPLEEDAATALDGAAEVAAGDLSTPSVVEDDGFGAGAAAAGPASPAAKARSSLMS